ncbi:MAG: FtsX-like permease family protein [Candidatus Parabeggiatoa sp.]|nr:FtsX-like permease family protein [Candidatus Parabeggiatoa sp.]
MILELTLSRYLVKPLFSILLGIGATIGVACLLIVMSLFENYYLSMEKVFMGIHPHVEIHKTDMPVSEAESVIKKLNAHYPDIDMIEAAWYETIRLEMAEVNPEKAFCVAKDETQEVCLDSNPQINATAFTRYGFEILKRETREFLLKGITIRDNKTVMDLRRIVNLDDLNMLAETTNANGRPIPWRFLIEQISPKIVKALYDDFLLRLPEVAPKYHHFRLRGVLDMGRKKGKLPLLIVSLGNAQQMLNKPDKVNTLEVKLSHPYNSDRIAASMQTFLGQEFTVIDWSQKEQAAFTFLGVTKRMAFVIIASILIVAAISVYSTLLLAVMQNQKKIAILKALGIRDTSIYMIFISNAMMIGVIGIIAGSLMGYVGSELLIAQFADSLQNLGLDNPQTEISGGDLLLITVFTLMLFVFTAIMPAKKAVTVEPVDNLQ